jgi:guanylate kinase
MSHPLHTAGQRRYGSCHTRRLFSAFLRPTIATWLIFITTKDAKTLKERLTGRGTETEEVINQRLARAAEEAEGVEAYDYIVINDILEDCVKTVDRIIKSEHNRTSEKLSTIQDIRMNLVSKGEIE